MNADALNAALERVFIRPPSHGSRKTTCPMCSHARAKANEKCLSIYPQWDRVHWQCHHCGDAGWEPLQ